MVRSGLVDVPWVSPYRLTAHLGLAVVLYSYLWWLVLDHWLCGGTRGAAVWHRRTGFALCTLVFLTLLSGGFVAGLKAGYAFNTFPLMAGEWLPPGYWVMEPGWRNLFENIPTVQFNHRVLGIASFFGLMVFVGVAWRRSARGYYRWLLSVLACAAIVQIGLGIATLLLHVPISLAALHQANALLLLTVSLCVAFVGRR
jgi:cytochrome c oxidase assembly protein subunit 15